MSHSHCRLLFNLEDPPVGGVGRSCALGGSGRSDVPQATTVPAVRVLPVVGRAPAPTAINHLRPLSAAASRLWGPSTLTGLCISSLAGALPGDGHAGAHGDVHAPWADVHAAIMSCAAFGIFHLLRQSQNISTKDCLKFTESFSRFMIALIAKASSLSSLPPVD